MDALTLAYLAGAMDSDGSFGIKRSTYAMRVRGDATQPVYSERAMLKQVTPEIPALLHECFGGTLRREVKGGNFKPLHAWMTTDTNAAKVAEALLPYLRVKRRQAELLLELRETKASRYRQAAHWFGQEFPNWRDMELLTTTEVMRLLGHVNRGSITQALGNGMLLALPYNHAGRWEGEQPRFPRLLVERLAGLHGRDGRAQIRPPQLIEWRERIYQQVRELNKIGVNGTSTYFLTGHHTPAVV